MTSLFAHGIFKSFLRLFLFLCNGQSLSVLPWLPCCFRATNKTTNGSLVCLINTGKRLKVVSGMTSISCQMVSVQIWTQPALLSQWSMSSLQSVPFLPSGDLSKISWVDDLLHSWHRGVNDYHYNFVLCSAGWESKLNMQWLCHPCQTARHLPQLPHTVLFTQPSQKIPSFRIFYFNHYLLIKNLYKKFC